MCHGQAFGACLHGTPFPRDSEIHQSTNPPPIKKWIPLSLLGGGSVDRWIRACWRWVTTRARSSAAAAAAGAATVPPPPSPPTPPPSTAQLSRRRRHRSRSWRGSCSESSATVTCRARSAYLRRDAQTDPSARPPRSTHLVRWSRRAFACSRRGDRHERYSRSRRMTWVTTV